MSIKWKIIFYIICLMAIIIINILPCVITVSGEVIMSIPKSWSWIFTLGVCMISLLPTKKTQ